MKSSFRGATGAFSVLIACASAPIAAQTAEAAAARVDSIFAEWDKPDSPGCALGVYRDDRIVYSRGYGMADLERHVPISPSTIFDIGSTSKQFTAAAILLLEQDGKLSRDDDVRKYLPELPAYDRSITIRHLLHHTSGIRDYIGLMELGGEDTDDVTTEEEALAVIVRQKALNFSPGDEQLYSNSGYFLLSLIVERVTGQSLRDFARQRIFAPLGMTRTHYLGSYDDIVPDRALAYSPRSGGGLRTDVSRWLQLGDGAVFTNVEELLRWDANFYEPKVGGPALLAGLHQTGVLTNGDTLSYAAGLVVGRYRGLKTVSHGGAWGGYRAELLRFPDQRFSVATLCNLGTTNPSGLARQVAAVYLEDELAPLSAARPAADGAKHASSGTAVHVPDAILRALAGTYRDSLRTIRMFAVDGGTLYLTIGTRRLELVPRSAGEFEVPGAPVPLTIVFERGTSRTPDRLRWSAEGQKPISFERIELVDPSAAALTEYAGSYYSEELDASHTLRVANGTLTLERRGTKVDSLRPLTRDEFSIGPVTLRFRRGADGHVDGYLLDMGRIRNLRFARSSVRQSAGTPTR